MRVELDRNLFRQLVWLDLASGFAMVVALAPTLIAGRWFEFGQAFDALVDVQFGVRAMPFALEVFFATALSISLLGMVACTIGLLWFQRWARLGFWLLPAITIPVLIIFTGFRPTVTSPFDDLFSFVNSAAFGAIVLLSHAKGFGAEWFAPPVAAPGI